jgi:nucleoid-associated protein
MGTQAEYNMQLEEAILHRIDKARNTSGAGTAKPHTRTTTLPIDERLARTADDILRIYGKSTSGYGTFATDETVFKFPVLLRDHIQSGTGFIPFTVEATKLISSKMGDELFATGSYALFLRYGNQGKDWLMVAMLKLKPGTGVDEQSLDLSDGSKRHVKL